MKDIMATLLQVENEALYLKGLLNSLEIEWDGKECILEMKNNSSTHWRQTEWIGFYAEYIIREVLKNQNSIKLNGETFGNVAFDLAGQINWDIKAHPNSARSAILNDCEATDLSIAKNNYHGLIILCVDCQFDRTGIFKQWHDQLKGGTSDYEHDRVARGAPSRPRKVSAILTDINFLIFDKSNLNQLNKAQEGWRNSGGGPRRAKYSITHKLIKSLSLN
jgi:hypothetical protein